MNDHLNFPKNKKIPLKPTKKKEINSFKANKKKKNTHFENHWK
jgi:hypothetical protein